MNISRLIALLSLTLALACGGSTPPVEEPAPEPVAEPEPAPEPEPEPVVAEPEDVHIEGDHLTIDRAIHFETDSDVILGDSFELLDHVATMLQIHEQDVAHLRIIGHTDAAGGHDHNQDLSERRAAAVVRALQERNVPTQLEASGVGETEPVCSEDTDDCHERNRRVEFLIVVDNPAG
ncbi:MAG: OmpA family protein [Myxococcota bacterium]